MGLGLLVDFLAGALTEAGCSSSEEYRTVGGSNGTFIIVINISHFTQPSEFKRRVKEVIINTKNSRRQKDVKEILIPGEPEEINKKKRLKDGIEIEETTWNSIVNIAEEYSINIDEFIQDH
jgi:LDH2 family malate/lactate/ureidoglycolate dehydrogenase